MLIVTADLPNKPQQMIERDISMFNTTTSNEMTHEANQRAFLNKQIDIIIMNCLTQYGGGRSSAFNIGVKTEITNYLNVLEHL